MQNNISIGIDLGTTYCCVGFYKNKTVEIIPDENGNRIMPSYVSFLNQEEKEEILIGESAKNIYTKNPNNTIYNSKRLISQKYSNKQIQQDMKHYSFKVKSDNQDNVMIDVNNTNYYPEEISCMLLSKIKENAENYLNQKITKAVITVPAYFNDAQRKATLRAGNLAGLEIDRIINEPTAAAIAYGLDKGNRNILIFDLGGGTLDTSILQVQDGLFEVKATSGNTHLGGEDFDNKLVEYCYSEFIKKNNFNKQEILELLTNTKYKSRLKKACEECKKVLSSLLVTNITIDSFYNSIDLQIKITRAKLEDLCNELFKSCIIPVEEVLQSAEMSKKDIDDIVLIGGSTRIPKIKELLKNYFNKEPKTEINPDEAVAIGASIQAAILNEVKDNILDNFLLLDVTPMSLGIETANELMTSIIPRNTAIPCEVEKIFTTYTDNQNMVNIKIYEGEKAYAKDNNLLGSFDLINLRPAKRGELKIKVKFSIDSNSILKVTALEEYSNVTNNITINNEKEKDKIEIKEQEIIEENKLKEFVICKNNLINYLINIKNNIMTIELKNKIGENKFKELNNLIKNNLDILDSLEDIEKIKENHIKIENEILNIINHKCNN